MLSPQAPERCCFDCSPSLSSAIENGSQIESMNDSSGGIMAIKTNQLICLGAMACIAVACVVASGCNHRPNFGPQGTIGMQRNRAVVHDPYPNNDLAPPIIGGRPLGYERASAESTALQSSPFAPKTLRGGLAIPNNGF